MDAAAVSELLEREHFSPFRIKFSNRKSIDIRNPNLVFVMKRDIFIADASRDWFHLYAMMHVVGIETLANAQRRNGRSRRKRR